MQYPLISDYKTAVLIPETFDKFQHLKPVTDSFGQPIFAAGGPAVVFKMYDLSTNKKFALKCFLKHQNNRKEHFDAVGNYLERIQSPYLCNYEYVEDEIWINESTFPVLVMDWIEGEMMSLHVAELCKKGDHEALSLLAGKFDALGLWLINSDLAHCDIKPDNILVTPKGDLKLVDYDGMYVPELKGKRSPELGTAEYRHPKRTPEDFGPQLDDFPILVLSLSLHSLAKDPNLYDSTINGDALMFRREDYTSLLTCRHLPFFIANQVDEVIGSRFSLLQFSLYQTIIDLKGLAYILKKTAQTANNVDSIAVQNNTLKDSESNMSNLYNSVANRPYSIGKPNYYELFWSDISKNLKRDSSYYSTEIISHKELVHECLMYTLDMCRHFERTAGFIPQDWKQHIVAEVCDVFQKHFIEFSIKDRKAIESRLENIQDFESLSANIDNYYNF